MAADQANGPANTIIHRRGAPEVVVRSAVLRVVSGPDTGAAAILELEPVIVGSSEAAKLRLNDLGVSRKHAIFYTTERGYLVRDLDSTNGTFFRGAQIQEMRLTVGQELRLGESVIRLERGEERSVSINPQSTFGSLIGCAPAMQQLFGLLSAVAPTEVTVLLLGETGSGKELAAKEIHRNSPRRDRAFVVVDCGSIPPDLVESELFGHEKGAFTGASSQRLGAFEQANGGTIFLDEIGELPLQMQTRLLRALDQRTIRRVGGSSQKSVDIRVIAATHRDLEARVREGGFREDLFYRLSVVQLQLPPLRERREDIPLLARHFLKLAGAANPDEILAPQVLEVLVTRKWPGNARELRNVIERALILQDSAADAFNAAPWEDSHEQQAIRPDSSGPDAAPLDPASEASWLATAMPRSWLAMPYKEIKNRLLDQFEHHYLSELLALHGNNISRIASAADVDRQLVRKLLRKHGLVADGD